MRETQEDVGAGAISPSEGMSKGNVMSIHPLRKSAFTNDELKTLSRVLAVLSPFRNIRATMPLQYIVSFLLVATDEGQSVKEYARRASVSKSVMSRHLLDIGERNRYMEKGHELVEFRINPTDMREHQVFLTDKGKRLAHELIKLLKL